VRCSSISSALNFLFLNFTSLFPVARSPPR
jgi:hypothetical protein